MADVSPPSFVAPPPIRAARPPSAMHALAQVHDGRPEPLAVILEDVGRKLLTAIQQHPAARQKLTEALTLITDAAKEGMSAPETGSGRPPLGPGELRGPLPPPGDLGGGGPPPPPM